jgi:hypothetical protein
MHGKVQHQVQRHGYRSRELADLFTQPPEFSRMPLAEVYPVSRT